MDNHAFLTRCARLANEFAELYKETGLRGVNAFDAPSIHLTEECFKKHFKRYTRAKRDSPEYPIELFVIEYGVKFFCICKEVDNDQR